jgi:hypothetical protein
MQEPERVLCRSRQARPVAPRRVEEPQRPDDVRLHEGLGRVDRPVDVALGGEVDDGADRVLGKEPADERLVADVAVDEGSSGVPSTSARLAGLPA